MRQCVILEILPTSPVLAGLITLSHRGAYHVHSIQLNFSDYGIINYLVTGMMQ